MRQGRRWWSTSAPQAYCSTGVSEASMTTLSSRRHRTMKSRTSPSSSTPRHKYIRFPPIELIISSRLQRGDGTLLAMGPDPRPHSETRHGAFELRAVAIGPGNDDMGCAHVGGPRRVCGRLSGAGDLRRLNQATTRNLGPARPDPAPLAPVRVENLNRPTDWLRITVSWAS